jgi:CBS domain-containing protein
MEQDKVSEAIRLMCQTNLGVMDKGFLCQSLSVLEPRVPACVGEKTAVEDVLMLLRAKKMGCVVVTDEAGKVSGIFSERDFLLKIASEFSVLKGRPIEEFMTRDPITQPPDGTVAYALNLMSQGGFRHIPIVDAENMPLGIISVKDVVDYIVESFTTDLLNFSTSE